MKEKEQTPSRIRWYVGWVFHILAWVFLTVPVFINRYEFCVFAPVCPIVAEWITRHMKSADGIGKFMV